MRGQRKLAEEMARRLGRDISTATVAYWRNNGAPIDRQYHADPDRLESWYRTWVTRNRPDPGTEGDGSSKFDRAKQALQLKILVQRERKLAMENDQRAGRLIAVEQAEHAYGSVLARLMVHFDHLPHLLADRLANKSAAEIRELLRSALRELRGRVSQSPLATSPPAPLAPPEAAPAPPAPAPPTKKRSRAKSRPRSD